MNQIQQYGEAVLQAAPAFYNQLSDAASRVVELSSRIAFYSGIAGIGVALLGKAVDLLCPYPDACLPVEAFKDYEVCLEKRNTAVVDLANPPRDWSDRLEDICKRELRENLGSIICDQEIHQEGVCYAARKTVTGLQKGIDVIAYIPNRILSIVNQAVWVLLPARGINFAYNRIFHRI